MGNILFRDMVKNIDINTSKGKEVIDITERIEELLPKKSGICMLFIKHTSAAIATAELDPGTDLDMLDAFDDMVPNLDYRHPHDPSHVGDHILSTLIGSSISIPVVNGSLNLGTWQRVVVFEFNGPRLRSVVVRFLEMDD